MSPPSVSKSLYDYPQYFDVVFRDETATEVEFFEEAFARFATGKVRRVYEPGCGSGRLVVAMAARGYDVTGLDMNRPSLAYLRRKLQRRGLRAELLQGDMRCDGPAETVDAAFCTFNTFRHLLSPQDALEHLRRIAGALRPGGLYILGFHIIPPDAEESCIERWRATHGRTTVSMTLRVLDFDRRRRQERLRISMLVRSPNKTLRCRSEFPLRLYTLPQVRKLLAEVPEFEVAGVYDFAYDLDAPRRLDAELADAIFVLRRR